MKDRFSEFAKDALAQMRCGALEALLRAAPLTRDPEELKLRQRCWRKWRSSVSWSSTKGYR